MGFFRVCGVLGFRGFKGLGFVCVGRVQAEVYCEVELLSYTPFKSYIAIGVAAAPYPPHHLPGLLPGSCALLSTGRV